MSVQFDFKELDRFLQQIELALDDATQTGGQTAVEIAQATVAVGEGDPEHLRDTIHTEPKGDGVVEVSAGEGLPDARAIYVELGTRHMAAQPYMLPAGLDPRVFEAIVAALGTGLK